MNRKQLILDHIGLVRSVAKRYRESGEPVEDLMGAGYLGLVKAAEAYNPALGGRFTTYAYATIKGYILHYLRDHPRGLKLPSWLWDQICERVRTRVRLCMQNGRWPTDAEVAVAMGISEEESAYLAWINWRRIVVPLSEVPHSLECPDTGLHQAEAAAILDQLFTHLSERECVVLYARHVEEMTWAEIAKLIDRCPNRTAGIAKEALAKLRRMVDADEKRFKGGPDGHDG